MTITHVYGKFWRVWDAGGFRLVHIEDAADEAEAQALAGVLVPWAIDTVTGVAARRGEGAPWLMVLPDAVAA